jgi:hypothetical protein
VEMLLKCKWAFPKVEECVLDHQWPVLQEEDELSVKQLHSSEWNKHCVFWKKTINVRSRRV